MTIKFDLAKGYWGFAFVFIDITLGHNMNDCFIEKWSYKHTEKNKIKHVERLIMVFNELDGWYIRYIYHTEGGMTGKCKQYFPNEDKAEKMFNHLKQFKL